MSYEYADPFNPWWAARAATEYILDAWRAILPWNVLRERSSPPDASPNARVTAGAASPDNPSAQIEPDVSRQIPKSLDANDDADKDDAWLNRFVREATCA